MNPSTSPGPRLNAIFKLLSEAQQSKPYAYIWDCCCDHGYLGIKILSENLCDKLIFVDQVAHIIHQLETKLAPFESENHELIIADAGQLSFHPDIRHLVVLAGVGGERIVQILMAIKKNNPRVEIDYVFCPSTSQAALREYLVAEKYGLLKECLVYENKRYYEILFVRNTCENQKLPHVSLNCDIWDINDSDQQRYLQKLARHEKLKQTGIVDKPTS